jgi:Cu(I)/Ag(I) efflux system membrane protein CusA/SilA
MSIAAWPIAVAGRAWFQHLLGSDLSVASAIGFIALSSVAAQLGVVVEACPSVC